MYDQDCKDDCLKGYLELMPCMTNEGFNCDDTCVAGDSEEPTVHRWRAHAKISALMQRIS